jgi:ABC-2 type transport system permease protein
MSGILVGVLLVCAVALRVWRRRGRRAAGEPRPAGGLGPFSGDVGLVAAREVRERFRARIFRVGTLIILVVVAAAIVIPKVEATKAGPQRVGVVGVLGPRLEKTVVASAESVGASVRFSPEPDQASAERALRAGRLDLVIVDRSKIVVNAAIGASDTSTTALLARAVSQALGDAEAVEAAHLSPSQATALSGARPLPVRSLQPSKPTGAAQTTSVIGLILIFVMLSQYNTWILMGVMEEKSSRVIEVLLAAVRPVRLLAGKVLGIGIVAFAQAALIVCFALVLAEAVGSDLLRGTAPLVVASTLLWLVLGYAFYCWVYAAAGSLAERQDQVQTLAFPLSLPAIFGYIMGLTAAGSQNASLFFKVLAYLPPTAPFAMPVLVGLKVVTWWEFAASAAISLACTVAVARLAGTIYRRAILRTGRRVPLREAFARGAR